MTIDERDPGSYIGHEPEDEAESIPGGVQRGDERTAANASRVGVKGEPETSVDQPTERSTQDLHTEPETGDAPRLIDQQDGRGG